jgi:hypothetical protein
VIFKQFTARDVVSRWDVLQAHTRATAQTATQFLDTLQHRMPFSIRAVQVDGFQSVSSCRPTALQVSGGTPPASGICWSREKSSRV